MGVQSLSPFGEILLKLLRENGGLSRSAISDVLSAPRTTVFDNLIYLERCGLVERNKFFNKKRKKGRPLILWSAVAVIKESEFK